MPNKMKPGHRSTECEPNLHAAADLMCAVLEHCLIIEADMDEAGNFISVIATSPISQPIRTWLSVLFFF